MLYEGFKERAQQQRHLGPVHCSESPDLGDFLSFLMRYSETLAEAPGNGGSYLLS